MSEKSKESTYYIIISHMYLNLTREVLFKVFKYLIKSDDITGFLSSPKQQDILKTLLRKHIISKKVLNHLSGQHLNLEGFDISLLIKLIQHLCEDNIEKPQCGWDSRNPNPNDESLGADLLRLRIFRNKNIGHVIVPRLSKEEYEAKFAAIEATLLRVVELVDSESSKVFQERIDEYKGLHLQWLQEKAEELFRRSQEFQVYYKATLSQFVRFIKLLFYGGRIALCGILKNKLGEQDLSDVLERKKETLTRNIGEKFSSCLYPQGSCSDYKIWDVSLLASVLLIAFKDDLGRDENNIENNIKCIQSIREKNAILVSQVLDKDDFFTMWVDLVNCLNKLSMNISEGERRQVDNLIERYKKKDEGGCDAEECIKQLREFGVDDDVYNAIVVELSDMLEQFSKEGIKLKQEHVIKLKLLTRCENEETKKKAKDLLKKYLKASIQQSDEPAGHLRNEIENLMASMSAVPDVTPV